MEIFKNRLLVISVSILVFLAILIFIFPSLSYTSIENVSIWIRDWFGNFYLYLGLFCVLFLLGIAISPLGKLRLGNTNDRPEYSRWAWISMLYSAGMGAGILLRAVQEPVYMYLNPPIQTDASKQTIALEYTFYQWGFTAWAFYGLFALVIGHYLFTKNKQALISSTVAPNFKNSGVLNGIDILVMLATVFGLVGAVGLGTTQINGGLQHLLKINLDVTSAIILTIIICGFAFLSAWKGINKGIKNISKVNIFITLLLLVFVLSQSDILLILKQFINALFQYLKDFIPLSLALGKYNPGKQFLTDWTYYYWAFWLAWAPFTGVFIARISKGRTLREMLLGVMIIPSLGSFLWFTAFGENAFLLIEGWNNYNNEFGDVFTSIFIFFKQYPLQFIINSTIVILLIGFLLTSVDSAIFVLSMFSDKGNPKPKKSHRIVWSFVIAIFSIAMLILGNAKKEIDVLIALQKLLIITSLPFALFIPIMSFSFLKELIQKKPS
ncbi:choline-glycine betaine transporter [Galbibacter orientalis DSM 19592]|uniref:Choline-glycine betaine transporter n=1 Tax=Galbibacter orientalis DSM 19592 TaxID=926559 RepID=I3C843_9FLAO|nr:BCCT family transporter [Galbibacter orientalis]EIJ39786.1 choline-glycine betaine transporter [Galbibacter orientalis DSM 19592]